MPDIANQMIGAAIARLRAEANVTQAKLKEKTGLDQSRISRIENGEVVAASDIECVLDALASLGVEGAADFKAFAKREWKHIEPPSFWNPQRACLEIAEETLGNIEIFLQDRDRPWPLRRQMEKHREALLRAANYLNRLNHNLAFLGDIGVGKSTAISFIFDLLLSASMAARILDRPVLETGGGGTTICEVHITAGPQFGISLVPMSDGEVRDLVGDFCAARWTAHRAEKRGGDETVAVSREVDRALRNMSGLVRRRETVNRNVVYHDPVEDLARSSGTLEEFRTRVLGLMMMEDRTRRELWYDAATRKHPMEWIAETFKAVNNGRVKDVLIPKSIDLLIPKFGRSLGELQITVIDTKGVSDVAVREDLDQRLRDPRTSIVFCSHFNDAPGTSTRVLLQHMRQTFSEKADTGKVSLLALPQGDEARAMKDDLGEPAHTDAEGYEFKRAQVVAELAADDLSGVPMIFFNAEVDDGKNVGSQLVGEIFRMRKGVEERLLDLCGAAEQIIENFETEALNAAIEEVASRLSTFLKGNRQLGARERLAYFEALSTVRGVRYASTLWASTRRNGEYHGLNILHLIGVGAARDARQRSEAWFAGLDAFVRTLQADDGLSLASKSIDQIAVSAAASRKSFLEAAQRGGVEVYREALSQAPIWAACVAEWGQGPGFKLRVARHLERWFEQHSDEKDTLEDVVYGLWEKTVIAPMLRLAEESAPEAEPSADNVVNFPRRATS